LTTAASRVSQQALAAHDQTVRNVERQLRAGGAYFDLLPMLYELTASARQLRSPGAPLPIVSAYEALTAQAKTLPATAVRL
jgi:hypothetical protein